MLLVNSVVFAGIFWLLFAILGAVGGAVLAVYAVVAGVGLVVAMLAMFAALAALMFAVLVPACIVIMPTAMAAGVCGRLGHSIKGKLCAAKRTTAADKDTVCNGAWRIV